MAGNDLSDKDLDGLFDFQDDDDADAAPVVPAPVVAPPSEPDATVEPPPAQAEPEPAPEPVAAKVAPPPVPKPAAADDDGIVSFGDLVRAADKQRRPAPAPAGPLAADKEDSGLADILSVAKSLKNKMESGSPAEPIAAVDDHDVAAATGLGFGTAAAVAVVEVKSADPPKAGTAASLAAPAAASSGGGGRMALVAGLVAAVAGLGWFAFGREPAPASTTAAAGAQQAPAPEPVRDQPRPEPERPPEPPPPEPPVADAADGELLALEEPTGESPTPGRGSGATPRDRPKSGADKSAVKDGDTAEAAKTAEAGESEDPDGEVPAPTPVPPTPEPDAGGQPGPEGGKEVDCLLDPTLPGCGGKPKTEQAKEETGDAALPEKLGQDALRAGFEAVKPAAKECGRMNNVAPGTKVKVKVSIEGATGRILKASALGEYEGTSVGRCVEVAVKAATFDKFGGQQMGITWPFSF
jgi:hypothetical protein